MDNFKVFFSNRTVDQSKVDELQDELRLLLPNLPFDDVSEDVPFSDDWKTPARTLLESCDALVCIVGPETHNSESVDWEIREAKKLAKPLLVARFSEGHQLPPCCKELHIPVVYSGVEGLAGYVAELLISRALFLRHDWVKGSPSSELIWNQYNLMVQSWEALIARRQTVNTVYISAAAALLAGIGVLISELGNTGAMGLIAGALLLSFLGSALSFNWRRTIISYGTLSTAKAKVIGALENYMPAQLFDAEWKVLEAKRYNSTTATDTQTSQFFMLLFIAIGLVSLGFLLGQVFGVSI